LKSGINTLFEAHSDAAREPERETGLFAFMLAAVHAPEETAVLEMIFRLLWELPATMEHPGSSVEIADSQKEVNESPETKFKVKGWNT
jgi:hypothetical protein